LPKRRSRHFLLNQNSPQMDPQVAAGGYTSHNNASATPGNAQRYT
jgi:hypothetical protein